MLGPQATTDRARSGVEQVRLVWTQRQVHRIGVSPPLRRGIVGDTADVTCPLDGFVCNSETVAALGGVLYDLRDRIIRRHHQQFGAVATLD